MIDWMGKLDRGVSTLEARVGRDLVGWLVRYESRWILGDVMQESEGLPDILREIADKLDELNDELNGVSDEKV